MRQALVWVATLGFGVTALACSAPVQEVNAPLDYMVTSTPFDPYHTPKQGAAPPNVVVTIDLENRYDFDLIPTEVNGVPLSFNRDHRDNDHEPLMLPPGEIRFVVKNTGTISHNFRIMGTDVDGRTLDAVTPGVDRFMGPGVMWEMAGQLKEGAYVMICNVENHDARGMKRPLIISRDVVFPSPPLH